MQDIAKLLRKRKPSGKDLGLIVLENYANTLRQQAAGESIKPLISDDKLTKFYEQIKDTPQEDIYNGYTALYRWLEGFQAVKHSHEQQLQVRYLSISEYITQATVSEDIYTYISRLPAIMTQKEYDEKSKKGIEEYFTRKDGKEIEVSALDVMLYAFSFYRDKLEDDPEAENPLQPIKEKYEHEPVTSPLITKEYCKVTAYGGYYEAPDGTRSNEVDNPDDWLMAIATPEMKKIIEAATSYESDPAEAMESIDKIEKMFLMANAKQIWNDDKPDENSKHWRDSYEKAGLFYPTTWHDGEELPNGLTKWDVLSNSIDLFFIYPHFFDNVFGNDKAYKEEASDFTAEFKDLVSILALICDSSGIFSAKISEMAAADLHTTVCTMRQLYESDFMGRKESIEGDIGILFPHNDRACNNGVAIIKESKYGFNDHISEIGYYKPPRIKNSNTDLYKIDGLYPESKDFESNSIDVETHRRALYTSYYYLQGYNKTLELIQEEYDLVSIDAFKSDLSLYEQQIDYINDLVLILYKRIIETDYEDPAEKMKKSQTLKKYFYEYDYKSLKTPFLNISEMKRRLKDPAVFYTPTVISGLMCVMPYAYKGEGGI